MMKFLLSLVTLLITISSCKSSTDAVENSKNMQETPSGTYYITHLGNTDISLNEITISFDETSNNITGFAGCNSFFGSYSIENNSITFSNIAASKKFCQKEIMSFESSFLATLNVVNSFSTDNNSISFLENDNPLIKGTSAITASKKSTTAVDSYKTAVKYEALTRGSFDFILISKTGISISKDRNLQTIEKHSIDTEQWEALKKLIDAVDLETLQELKPPSQNHQHDGAAHATLALQIGDLEYMTPTFDHGNPPKEIEALVNKVLSIKEKTVKQ